MVWWKTALHLLHVGICKSKMEIHKYHISIVIGQLPDLGAKNKSHCTLKDNPILKSTIGT